MIFWHCWTSLCDRIFPYGLLVHSGVWLRPVQCEVFGLDLFFTLCFQVHKISQADINTEIIFNCQMGRGRTTTGMVIATLIYFNRIGASGSPVNFFLFIFNQFPNLMVITSFNGVSYIHMKQVFQGSIPLGQFVIWGQMLLTICQIQKRQFVEENMQS